MRSKLTPEQWNEVVDAYAAWDPEHPNAPTISGLAAQWGISKQSMYAELRKRGVPLKRNNNNINGDGGDVTSDEGAAIRALAELLVQARLRIESLQAELATLTARNKQLTALLVEHGIPIPNGASVSP